MVVVSAAAVDAAVSGDGLVDHRWSQRRCSGNIH